MKKLMLAGTALLMSAANAHAQGITLSSAAAAPASRRASPCLDVSARGASGSRAGPRADARRRGVIFGTAGLHTGSR